jgi:hypothetical protein
MAVSRIEVDENKTYEVRIENKEARFIFRALRSGTVYYRSSIV